MTPGYDASPYFIFTGDAAPGFSGGPVVDSDGRLIGITFGYKDEGKNRLIYAYDMARVRAEFSSAGKRRPAGMNSADKSRASREAISLAPRQ